MLCHGCLQETYSSKHLVPNLQMILAKFHRTLYISCQQSKKKNLIIVTESLESRIFFAINNTNHITKESLTKDRSISFSEKIIWLNIGFFSQTGQYIVIVQVEMWMKETTNKVQTIPKCFVPQKLQGLN